jgi:hypothetical protein
MHVAVPGRTHETSWAVPQFQSFVLIAAGSDLTSFFVYCAIVHTAFMSCEQSNAQLDT